MGQREYRERRRQLGLCVYCSQPTCAQSRSACDYHRLKRAEEVKQWVTPEYRRAKRRRDRQRHPEQYKARTAVYRAIASGKMIRPEVCDKCNSPCRPQAHHEDYANPLIVEWLCQDCHHLKHHPLILRESK